MQLKVKQRDAVLVIWHFPDLWSLIICLQRLNNNDLMETHQSAQTYAVESTLKDQRYINDKNMKW